MWNCHKIIRTRLGMGGVHVDIVFSLYFIFMVTIVIPSLFDSLQYYPINSSHATNFYCSKRMRKNTAKVKAYNIGCSQAVTHSIIDPARRCLASLIGRDPTEIKKEQEWTPTPGRSNPGRRACTAISPLFEMNLLSDTTKSTEARLETSLSVVGVRAVTKARSTFGTLYAKQSRTRGTGLTYMYMYVNMYHSPRAWSWGGDGEGLNHHTSTIRHSQKLFIPIRQRSVTLVGFYFLKLIERNL